MAARRATSKSRTPKHSKYAPEIRAVIRALTTTRYLCPTGKERLVWWKAQGWRYRTLHHATARWTPTQKAAFAGWLGETAYRRDTGGAPCYCEECVSKVRGADLKYFTDWYRALDLMQLVTNKAEYGFY